MSPTTPQLESRLSALYGFQDIEWLGTFGSYSSLNLHMRSDKTHWLVKRYGKLAPKRLVELNTLAKFLQSREFPTVSPLANRLGLVDFQCGDETFAVFPVIDGHTLHGDELTLPSLTRTAQLIAQFHRLGGELPLTLGSGSRSIPGSSDFRAEGRALIGATFLSKLPQSVVSSVLHSLTLKQTFLDACPVTSGESALLDSATDLVHGDFHNENVLYSAAKIPICLLDFEECSLGHRAVDLVNFVQLALCNDDYSTESLARGRHFLRAYAEYADLKDSEIQAGLRYSFASMATSLFFEKKLCEGGDPDLTTILQRDLRKIEFYQKYGGFLHESHVL